jgi:hypothetical protein
MNSKRDQRNKNRPENVGQFRKTFSRLPHDIQMYIREFLPNVFLLTKLTGIIILDRKFAYDYYSLTKYSNITKDEWNRIYTILQNIQFANKLCRNSKPIYFFERISELYKNIYLGHYKYAVNKDEYSLPKRKVIKTPKKSERLIAMVQAMQEIKNIMRPGTIRRFLG